MQHSSRQSRRGRNLSTMNTSILLLLGLCILNAIIGCQAFPHPIPEPQESNEEFRPNFATLYGAPLITPLMEDVTLEVDSMFTLSCEANEPIVWKVHNDGEHHKGETFSTQDPERAYGSKMVLVDISYLNVGNYYCIKESSLTKNFDSMEEQDFVELVNNNQASTIYIYVNDKENLLVPIDFPVGSAIQYQDTTIPCKPTMPTVEVLLTTPTGDTFSSETTGRYDPKRGFVIEIRGVTECGRFVCRPKIPSTSNEEEETEITIDFLGNNQIDLKLTTKTTRTTTAKSHLEQLQLGTTPLVEVTTAPTTLTATTTTLLETTNRSETSTERTVTNIVNVTNSIVDLTTRNGVTVKMATVIMVGSGIIENGTAYATDSVYDDGFGWDEDWVVDDNNDDDDDDDDGDKILNIQIKKRKHSKRVREESSTTRKPSTKYVNKPVITSVSRGHADEGETFQLVCEVVIAHDVRFTTDWVIPSAVDMSRVEKKEPTFNNYTATHNLGRAVLTVTNAKKSDSGMYICNVTDHSKKHAHNKYLMTVLKPNETYIDLKEPSGIKNINDFANKTINMFVQYRGHPWPTLSWHRPDGTEIQPTSRFLINTTDSTTNLRISEIQMKDSGRYVVRANNGRIKRTWEFNVSISDKPIVSVNDVYVQVGEEAHLNCSVLSVPPALVTWTFTPCSISPRWPSCDKNHDQSFNSSRKASPGDTIIEYIHQLYFMPKEPGIMHCLAKNKVGMSVGKGHVLIGDITDNLTVYGVDENKKIARGDEVIITCAALAYYFSDDLFWYKDEEEVIESDDIEITTFTSEYSYKKALKFTSIQDLHRGSYECRARGVIQHDHKESKFISIFVHEPAKPKMLYTNLDSSSKMNRKLGETLGLKCKSEAIPRASVQWYKDSVLLNTNDNIIIEEEDTKLTIPFMKPENEGVYRCVVSNRLGMIEASVTVKITNMPGLKFGWILATLFILIILILLVIYFSIRFYRERNRLRELKAAGLANFVEGAIEQINPALTLDEQADLLPYDRKFEFPREKLKLGKQLGAGAFGVVLKAEAEGIKPDEHESVVAVKMVKRLADNEVMRALVSELKIMVHLGQHLNVVNLLGAVTKDITKRELMVIVEYCRYGNVQNFLLRNRKRFINQIHPETNRIDPTITTQRFSDNFELNRDGLKYVNIPFSNHQYINHMNNKNNMNNNYTINSSNSENDPRSGTRAGRPNSSNVGYTRQADLYEGQLDSCATEHTVMTTIPEDDDNILSNNSVQPAWRSNYKPDSTEAMTITTSDLVSWAFQVARGMDYLSSKKVLHGDLAARNILLCEDNVVKICDFGLARTMYKSDNYKKQGESPLPIKWLALESLSDHVFSTYTDVWSFGIVMWEFFSLAKVPYPGMDPNQSLYLRLKDGYRMEQPTFANDELYDIMLECWSTNPECRPLFNVLEKKFARMLGDEVTNHYVDLNDPYLRINTEYMRRTQTDYLALMGSPDEMAPAPPRYVNGHIVPDIRIEPSSSDDYLAMSTETGNAIFSPTRPKENASDEPTTTTTSSFTFPPDTQAPTRQQNSPTLTNNMDSPASGKQRHKDVQPEEMPMLHNTYRNGSGGGSDSETSPEQGRKFANVLQQVRPTPTPSPRHHVETELNEENSNDNYVNVKSPARKHLNNNNGAKGSGGSRAPEAFSNPSYQMLKKSEK